MVTDSLRAFEIALGGLIFRGEQMAKGLEGGETQTTDLAERLVARGVPFREAYKAVGAVVRAAREKNRPMSALTAADLPPGGLVTGEDLSVLDAASAVAAKEVPGGTGPESVAQQLDQLEQSARGARARVAATPRLAQLIPKLAAE